MRSAERKISRKKETGPRAQARDTIGDNTGKQEFVQSLRIVSDNERKLERRSRKRCL